MHSCLCSRRLDSPKGHPSSGPLHWETCKQTLARKCLDHIDLGHCQLHLSHPTQRFSIGHLITFSGRTAAGWGPGDGRHLKLYAAIKPTFCVCVRSKTKCRFYQPATWFKRLHKSVGVLFNTDVTVLAFLLISYLPKPPFPKLYF